MYLNLNMNIKQDTPGVEVNGPANIIIYLNAMLDNGKISTEDHALLVKQAEKTIEYMKKLSNSDDIKWHQIK